MSTGDALAAAARSRNLSNEPQIARAVDELIRAHPDQRARPTQGVLDACRGIGRRAVPVLRAMLAADSPVPESLQELPIDVLLATDRDSARDLFVSCVDDLPAGVLAIVLPELDPSEAIDVVGPRFERDAHLRGAILRQNRCAKVLRDDRYLELALRVLHIDASCACLMLQANRSARAREELIAIVERGVVDDMPVVHALRALSKLEPPEHDTAAYLARLLVRAYEDGGDELASRALDANILVAVEVELALQRELIERAAEHADQAEHAAQDQHDRLRDLVNARVGHFRERVLRR